MHMHMHAHTNGGRKGEDFQKTSKGSSKVSAAASR